MRCSVLALVAVLSVVAGASGSEIEGRWDLVRVEHDGQVSPAWKFFYKHILFRCSEYEYVPDEGVSNRGPFDLGTYKLDPDQDPKELDFFARNPGRGENLRKGIYELDG